MGGEEADLDISEGGKTSAWLATLPADGPTGGYFIWSNGCLGEELQQQRKEGKIMYAIMGITGTSSTAPRLRTLIKEGKGCADCARQAKASAW